MHKNTVLFETPIGSRLYGTHKGTSDYDTYRVVKGRAHTDNPAAPPLVAQQVKTGDQDVTTVPFSLFITQAHNGVPMALEAMFAPATETDFFRAYRQGFHADTSKMRVKYRYAIRKFSEGETYKSRFHALRLVHNLNESYTHGGRFNPVLSEETRLTLGAFASFTDDRYFRYLHMLPVVDLSQSERR